MDDGADVGSRQWERTVAVMLSTVEQLRLTAQILGTAAAAAPNPETAARLQALADDVSAQVEDIQRRADHLTGGDCGGS
ncbi:hypothetical protein [Winogradskya humida]|uniref:Uncharacterized protein n=1 Tax=Winogradskya humida TaxID=113566 RepID=A0ABQ3ZXU5_9ACTN|nr:hypothetical protein [Actinoplanes humidus]GIE23002.1 hypothetical protein Ahu01nite_061040 [Actinoplanes humidus]